jgi:uroporphyrinogen decarboxylase
VYTYDDVASQRSLLMSKDVWKDIVKPYHVQLSGVIKSLGKTVMYHSCGSVYQMIPLFAELPIDVLNPLQPLAEDMDFKKIKENFGETLCFHGGMDIQFLLPKGSVKEVEDKVKETIDILSKNGGYILTSAHYIQADTPVKNIIAMYETAYNYSLENK